MLDTVRKLDYFAIQAPDRPGEGGGCSAALKGNGVNLLALSASGRRKSQIDLVPEDAGGAACGAKKMKLRARRAKKHAS